MKKASDKLAFVVLQGCSCVILASVLFDAESTKTLVKASHLAARIEDTVLTSPCWVCLWVNVEFQHIAGLATG